MTSSARPSTFLLLLLVVVLGSATTVHAQPSASTPAAPAEDAAGRAHFQQGQALMARSDYAGAYREFDAGYKAHPRPAFLFNMGEAARAMRDPVAARAAYERFLAVEPSGALATSARQRLAELGPAPQPAPPGRVPTPSEAAATIGAAPIRPVVARPEPAPESRPMWKKWPFWAAVGGVIATGVVVGMVATRDGGPSCEASCLDVR
jgi:tetratricopeptide (TPR) repeat protein